MLDDERKEKLQQLFAEGAELPPEQRRAFVERACGDDAELRSELAELLDVAAHRLESFLTTPAVGLPSVAAPMTAPDLPGYADLTPVGQGGMGAVFKAQQLAPVRRTVAIKAIRPGMDSEVVLRRFDAEREALARMAHPCIATVFDAGVDAAGRPYLVMEFVDGEPITDYCERHALPLEARLELFVKVCEAVDHAHRRGVLHRDLKPSNVLVVHDDAHPLPKVIDFGIAKALSGPLGEHSIHTVEGAFVGTPEYMSPEQIEADGRGVDTGADVYALGVMLYELLCGERPFDSERLRSVGIAELVRIVRYEVPAKPSTRVRRRLAMGSAGPAAAGATIAQRLKGELDWVVMKALEKDPRRRYASAREFAVDVQRFLRHEPVEAGPPSGFYRVRKFVRRYRLQVAALALVSLSLTVGLFGTLWFLFESKQNEADAVRTAREAEGNRIAAAASLVAEEDVNLALLLDREAAKLTSGYTVNETAYKAMQKQNLVGRFLHSDYGTRHVRFLADGRMLSCGIDPVFWLADTDSGALLRRYVGHSDSLSDLALSPSQAEVVTGSADDTARVWDVASGDVLHVLEHPDDVLAVRWTRGGGAVFTLCRDGLVRAFSPDTGSLRATVGADVAAIELDHTGERVVAATTAGATFVWDADGAVALQLAPDPAMPDVAERRVRHRAQLPSDGQAVVRSWIGGQQPARVQVCSPDGELRVDLQGIPVAVFGDELWCGTPGSITVVSLRTGEVRARRVIDGLTMLIAIAPDRTFAIATDERRDLRIVDLERDRFDLRLAGHSDKNHRNHEAAFHPDGVRFAVTGPELGVWRRRPEFAPLPLGGRGRASIHADGGGLVVHGGPAFDAPWSLWSMRERRKLRDLPIRDPQELFLTSSGTQLVGVQELVSNEAARSVVTWYDLEGQLLRTLDVPSQHPRISADGERLAYGLDGEPVVVDPDGVVQQRGLDMPFGSFHWGLTRDRRYLCGVFGSRTGVRVFDLEQQGRTVAEVWGPEGAGHYAAAVDAENQRLLIVLGDLRARVYDLRDTGRGPICEYARIVRSNGYTCRFVPNTSLAWVRCSNEVHVFDVETGKPFAVLRLADDVVAVEARTDGSELVTVDSGGRCQRWPLDAVGVVERLARGELTLRELAYYGVGTARERAAREEQRLRDNPTSRNLAMLGELLLARGDLDGAIGSYRSCCATGPLRPSDLRRYLRLLELLARRRGDADVAMATDALREAVRRGATRERLDRIPGFAELAAHPDLRRLLPR